MKYISDLRPNISSPKRGGIFQMQLGWQYRGLGKADGDELDMDELAKSDIFKFKSLSNRKSLGEMSQ